MAFVELEKAIDGVPRKVIWWVLRKLDVDNWIVLLFQRMHTNAWSCIPIGKGYIQEFEVKVGVHQGSVLSLLLLIIMLEALLPSFTLEFPGRTSRRNMTKIRST